MEQNIDPPNLDFWTLAVTYFHIILAIFKKKNQLEASESGKCWKQTKVVKISKNIIFKPFFYMMEQKFGPQPRFSNSCCNGLKTKILIAISRKVL